MDKNFLHVNDLNSTDFHEIINLSEWIKDKFNKREIKLINSEFIQDIDYAVKRTFAT